MCAACEAKCVFVSAQVDQCEALVLPIKAHGAKPTQRTGNGLFETCVAFHLSSPGPQSGDRLRP